MASTGGRHQSFSVRLAAVVVLVGVACWPTAGQSVEFPPLLQHYLNIVRPSSADRRELLAGEPLARLLDNDAAEQVSVFGAVWVDVPARRYVQALRQIETWERGRAFHVTQRVSRPPRLDDFAPLRLTTAVVDGLEGCRVGDCVMKLDEQAIAAFKQEIDWASPGRHAEAEHLMRRVLFDYSTRYLFGGSDRLPLLRDRDRPVSMGEEFRAIVGELPILSPTLQTVRAYIVDYPRVTLPGSESFLYWQETEFGLRPTIRLSHITLLERGDEYVVASRMVYASHYFRGAVELRVLVPDPARGRGFWLVTLTASRTDGMTGLTGLFVRRRVRGEARDGVAMMMRNAKRRLEMDR